MKLIPPLHGGTIKSALEFYLPVSLPPTVTLSVSPNDHKRTVRRNPLGLVRAEVFKNKRLVSVNNTKDSWHIPGKANGAARSSVYARYCRLP